MSANRDSHLAEALVSFLAGAATGFIVGILMAPASGQETRKKLKDQAGKAGDAAKDNYDKIAKEAEKGIRVVREKTSEGIDAIKEFIEKKKDEFSRKSPFFPEDEATDTDK